MPIDYLGIVVILAENFMEKESYVPGVTFGTLMLFLFLFNHMNQQKQALLPS